jgi:hypothetical protein
MNISRHKPEAAPPQAQSSRRSIFGSIAAVAVAAPAMAASTQPPSPDTYLLWMIACYNDLEQNWVQALNAAPEDIAEDRLYDQRVVRPIEVRQRALLARIHATTATTAEGLLARIGMLAFANPDLVEHTDGEEGMIAAIIRDGLALQAGGLV